MFPDSYKPKLLKKAPSMRAINNYNNISTSKNEDELHTYDNFVYLGDEEPDQKSYTTKVGPSEFSYQNFQDVSLRESYGFPQYNGGIVASSPAKNPDSIPLSIIAGDIDMFYDYPTMRSSSGGTTVSSNTDYYQDGGGKDDLGSTSKLVSPKVKSVSICLI